MRKILLNIFCAFIPSKRLRKKIRRLCPRRTRYSSENTVHIPKNLKNIDIVLSGKKNYVLIDDNIDNKSRIKIRVYGDGNSIIIGSCFSCISIQLGYGDGRRVYNSSFNLSDGGIINSANFLIIENDTSINIGNECMFSSNIEFRCTDDHVILNENNEVINLAKSIEIGNHVWIGKDVLVLKNSVIPDGCIVGAKSVIAKKFTKKNTVIVGNPARVVKENIHWARIRPNNFLKEIQKGD